MSAFLDKLGSFFFKNEEELEDDLTLGFEETPASRPSMTESRPQAKPQPAPARKPNLISVPTKSKNGDGNLEIVLFKAKSYDDMQEIARQIKDRKIAVVNFEDMDKDVAQRMVDFLSGAAFALDGAPRKVSGGTFIFGSSLVDVTGQIMPRDGGAASPAEDLADDSRFSSNQWLRS